MASERDSSHYVHGSTPQEQARLSRLNEVLEAACLRELDLAGGERVLDLGSGLGQLARAMARRSCSVVGIERDPEQLAKALDLARTAGEEGAVDFRSGEAAAPPLTEDEWGSFDLAHTRFLLEHLAEPQPVVDAMVRAVRPGGRIVLCDDDHDLLRLEPAAPGVELLWRSYMRTYELRGKDPQIGRRLVSLLVRAGARPVRATWMSWTACQGQDTYADLVENLHQVLAVGARAELEELLPGDAVEQGLAELRRWSELPDAVLWFGLPLAEGRRRA